METDKHYFLEGLFIIVLLIAAALAADGQSRLSPL